MVVQVVVADPSEADMLARRIVRSLDAPYVIADQVINIGTSIGYCLSNNGTHNLGGLIDRADGALLVAKSRGGGVLACGGEPRGHAKHRLYAEVAKS